LGPVDGPGPGTSQHSILVVQQLPPQQAPLAPHVPGAVHGGVPHVPKWQNGVGPVHLFPQAPQLSMSFCS
jgi:hypothetical protein